MDKFLINLSRLLIAVLIVFELLNQFNVLHYALAFTWFGLVLTSASIWIILELVSLFIYRKCKKVISGLAMITTVGVVYVDALGDVLNLYGRFGWYDQLSHFLGGAAVGWISFSLIKSLLDCEKIKLGLFGASFFAWATSGFFGILYELEEYFEDYFRGINIRLGDGPDTANDLFLDLAGAFIAIALINVFIYAYRRSRSAN